MTRRNVKVIQPGLVYVIEWDAGGDPAQDLTSDSPIVSTSTLPPADDDATLNGRDKRRAKRDAKRGTDKPPPELPSEEPEPSEYPIYVAYVFDSVFVNACGETHQSMHRYHDWEHFSSIRNLRGPHAGLPNIRETPVPDGHVVAAASPRKPPSKVKPKVTKPISKVSQIPAAVPVTARPDVAATVLSIEPGPSLPLTPSQVPLPASRSPSPDTFSQAPLSSRSSILPSTPISMVRAYRSPKRTFDESSASSEDSHQGLAKRAKPASQLSQTDSISVIAPTSTPEVDISVDLDDADLDTPSLSAASPASPASSSSLSSVPSPAASPPPEPQPVQKPLTRRQRKQLGLPKPRPAVVGSAKASAGKIIIPGGRYKPKAKTEQEEEEWVKNGTGRVDVRGFRELKI